jgi:hypothetical protein
MPIDSFRVAGVLDLVPCTSIPEMNLNAWADKSAQVSPELAATLLANAG